MIYFIQIKDSNGSIKIGFTVSPQKRLREIQTFCPSPVTLLNVIEGDWETEQRIHSHFAHLRLHGEWFSPNKELLAFIGDPYEIEEIKRPINSTPESAAVPPQPNPFNDLYPELLTPEAAAVLLGISPALVRRYCRQGRLGRYVAGRWLITPDDLNQFREKPRQSGNPEFGPTFRKSKV